MRNYDLEFLKHFSMVIGFLVLLTVGLIVGARLSGTCTRVMTRSA